MMIRTKLLCAAAALIVGGGAIVASVGPASARDWRYHHFGWGPAAVAGGIVGGAVAAATSPLWAPGYDNGYGPDYAYGYGPYDYDAGPPVVEGRSAAVEEPMGDATAYCEAHFKSFDPSSGTYLGYDGVRHHCP
jgi:hypothetical protein